MPRVRYVPPEIIKGEEHSPAVDWWILGVLTYEMMHSITPFRY